MPTATSAEVRVAIPAHCSSLGLLPGRVEEFLLPPADRTGRRGREDADESGGGGGAVLAVQCHRDGIAWREFVPMLRSRSNPALERAVLVLVEAFGGSARVFAPASGDGAAGGSRQAEARVADAQRGADEAPWHLLLAPYLLLLCEEPAPLVGELCPLLRRAHAAPAAAAPPARAPARRPAVRVRHR